MTDGYGRVVRALRLQRDNGGPPVAEVRYTLPGRPVTWQRTYDISTGHTADRETLRKVESAKRSHALMFAQAKAGRTWPMTGAFEIEVIGYWPDAQCGDSDRLPGCVMDALQGSAYKADRQVRSQTGRVRCDGTGARVEVILRRLESDPVQDAKTRARGRAK